MDTHHLGAMSSATISRSSTRSQLDRHYSNIPLSAALIRPAFPASRDQGSKAAPGTEGKRHDHSDSNLAHPSKLFN